MSWRCPQCGVENEDAVDVCAGMCGHARLTRLVLTATSGQEIRFNVDTEVGRVGLQKVCGEEARFASQPQFRVLRDTTTPRWLISHMPTATNITCLNAKPLSAELQPLKNGDVISIGTKRAALRVRLEKNT